MSVANHNETEKHIRERITAELREVCKAIAQSEQSAATVELDQSSIGRVSRMDAMQQQALAKGVTERMNLRRRKLEAALARLDAGTYGQCCACQDEIGQERLAADPAAVFCADCADERESPNPSTR